MSGSHSSAPTNYYLVTYTFTSDKYKTLTQHLHGNALKNTDKLQVLAHWGVIGQPKGYIILEAGNHLDVAHFLEPWVHHTSLEVVPIRRPDFNHVPSGA